MRSVAILTGLLGVCSAEAMNSLFIGLKEHSTGTYNASDVISVTAPPSPIQGAGLIDLGHHGNNLRD
jgi:hypothetical protein